MGMTQRIILLLLAVVLAACSSAADDQDQVGQSKNPPPEKVTVLAAASLTEAFTTIAGQLESEQSGLDVTFSFGPSSTLAEQIVAGAEADVFAAASPVTMAIVTDADLTSDEPVLFARNILEIAVPKGNPAGISGLRDFARPDLRLAICDVKVPCGAAAAKVLKAANVEAQPDTLETDVKATLAKVQLGEVDAAMVYATDVRAGAVNVDGIAFPEAAQAVNDYLVARLKDAPHDRAAQTFIDAVMSVEGQQVLHDAGFLVPT
jgi:molybdate transport system substrate-binding protein